MKEFLNHLDPIDLGSAEARDIQMGKIIEKCEKFW